MALEIVAYQPKKPKLQSALRRAELALRVSSRSEAYQDKIKGDQLAKMNDFQSRVGNFIIFRPCLTPTCQ